MVSQKWLILMIFFVFISNTNKTAIMGKEISTIERDCEAKSNNEIYKLTVTIRLYLYRNSTDEIHIYCEIFFGRFFIDGKFRVETDLN